LKDNNNERRKQMTKTEIAQKMKFETLENRVKILEINTEILKILVGRYASENGIRIETLKSGIVVISEQIKKKA